MLTATPRHFRIPAALALAAAIALPSPAPAAEDFLSAPVCEQGGTPVAGAYLAGSPEGREPCAVLDESWRAFLPLKKSVFALCAPKTRSLAGFQRCEFEVQKVLLPRIEKELGPVWTEARITAWLDALTPSLIACQPGEFADRTEDLMKAQGKLRYHPMRRPAWGAFFDLCLDALDSRAGDAEAMQ